MRVVLIGGAAAEADEFLLLLRRAGFADASLVALPDARTGEPRLRRDDHDIGFVRARLPDGDGLALIGSVRAAGAIRPLVLLTEAGDPGAGDPDIDAAAVRAGASDWLARDEVTARTLGRTVRRELRDAARVQAAALAEARSRTYFDGAEDSLFHVRPAEDGRLVLADINPAGTRHLPLPPEQARGRAAEDLLGAETGGLLAAGLRRVHETGQSHRCEATVDLDGSRVMLDTLLMPLRDAGGAVAGVLGRVRDITERRRLEASLHQTQKMESLGELAGGVAHDFNNLLTAMHGCFRLLTPHVASERGRLLLDEGRSAVERGVGLTRRMLAFSRQRPAAVQAVDLNAGLEDMTALLERTLGPNLRFVRSWSGDLWPALADPAQIDLAVLNLAINARDAMPEGGDLTLETRNETVTDVHPDGPAPGDYVAIAVADTGAGMTPEVLARAREPFFTTKEAGKGTGLGLSLVSDTLRQIGGGLRIESEAGRGTRVTLYLRRAGPASSSPGPLPPSDPPA